MIVERTGADVWSFLLSHDTLWKYRRNLKIVKQTIYNDISRCVARLTAAASASSRYWIYAHLGRLHIRTFLSLSHSSKVRLFVRRGQSIKYLLPNSVIKYIESNNLVSHTCRWFAHADIWHDPDGLFHAIALLSSHCSTNFLPMTNTPPLLPRMRTGNAQCLLDLRARCTALFTRICP